MDIFVGFIGLIFLIGAGVAVYEWRKGKSLLTHDFDKNAGQTEADREAIRAQEAVRNRTFLDGSDHH